jgi:hypothetical protein
MTYRLVLRSAVAGIVSGALAIVAGGALITAYLVLAHYARVDDADSSFTLGELKLATDVLLVLCVVAPVLTSILALRLFGGRLLLVSAIVVAVLVVPAVYSIRQLSHLNACEIGASYPLDGYYKFQGHECGR